MPTPRTIVAVVNKERHIAVVALMVHAQKAKAINPISRQLPELLTRLSNQTSLNPEQIIRAVVVHMVGRVSRLLATITKVVVRLLRNIRNVVVASRRALMLQKLQT